MSKAGEYKNDVIILRINDSIKKKIMKRITELNLSVSEYIRALMFIDAGLKIFETLELDSAFIKQLDSKLNLSLNDVQTKEDNRIKNLLTDAKKIKKV